MFSSFWQLRISVIVSLYCKKNDLKWGWELHLPVGIRKGIENAAGGYIDLGKWQDLLLHWGSCNIKYYSLTPTPKLNWNLVPRIKYPLEESTGNRTISHHNYFKKSRMTHLESKFNFFRSLKKYRSRWRGNNEPSGRVHIRQPRGFE